MNYDTWKAAQPDEDRWENLKCATPDCDNSVVFPDFEVFCTNCLVTHEHKRRILREQQIRR